MGETGSHRDEWQCGVSVIVIEFQPGYADAAFHFLRNVRRGGGVIGASVDENVSLLLTGSPAGTRKFYGKWEVKKSATMGRYIALISIEKLPSYQIIAPLTVLVSRSPLATRWSTYASAICCVCACPAPLSAAYHTIS